MAIFSFVYPSADSQTRSATLEPILSASKSSRCGVRVEIRRRRYFVGIEGWVRTMSSSRDAIGFVEYVMSVSVG